MMKNYWSSSKEKAEGEEKKIEGKGVGEISVCSSSIGDCFVYGSDMVI